MVEEHSSLPSESLYPRTGFNIPVVVVWALITILLTALAYWLGTRQSFGPGETSAEVGFARDMITHHAQAVDMAILLRDRSDDPELRQIALDMLLTQQGQIGQMQGWLNAWGYPLASSKPAMEWMGMMVTGLMPGMATPEQMNQLRELHGVEAEIHFLQIMITHHQSGVMMGEAALERAKDPAVLALAQSIVDSQTYEIELMENLLHQRGSMPPEAPAHEEEDHGGSSH